MGRPPIGAVWLEDEGSYECTQEYFEYREQSFISNRLKLKQQYKQRAQILKDTRPYLWKSKVIKKENTLEPFLRVKNVLT